MKTYNNYLSSFWMDERFDEDPYYGWDKPEPKKKRGKDLIKLAGYRRAISNFVNIVTGKSIKVKYIGSDSYTDGDTVTLTANLSEKNFDPMVGLALHEGSHILLSDFDILEKIIGGGDYLGSKVPPLKNMSELETLKDLLNYVEDRRIDYYIYKNAPGYKGYYHSLYDKYFNAKVVDKALQSEEKRKEDWASYIFRFFNLTNKNRDLDALKGLREIWDELDLKNISRLSSTEDAHKVAYNILKIMQKYITEDRQKGKKKGKGNGKSGCNSGGKGQTVELSKSQLKQLENQIEKQREFLSGDIKKTKINKKEAKTMVTIEKSGVEVKKVYRDGDGVPKCEVIIINKLTQELIDSEIYNFLDTYHHSSNAENIQEGIILGKKLGKKLKITCEERETVYSRQKKGRIDSRLIAELGCDNENVFYKLQTDKYKKSVCHISIDGSGSMWGSPFKDAIKMATATAIAAKMTPNLEVVISFRYTVSVGQEEKPAVLMGYDSRKDKITKIKKYFPSIGCSGITPEGLCFEAILDKIIDSADNRSNKYFINLSDGYPNFHCKGLHYGYHEAFKHTRAQVDKMKRAGVKVLSYLAGSGGSSDNFRKMYGNSARYISLKNINKIALTLNELFLSGANKITTLI